ncbi:MarR family transcriptional regulator [Phytohabitans sp. ZYX-F-186]|uniref:MarR family transcriptional regulator n=1 Tax=Phytohabitans maris TaxID=3071409 RepID=A0ABU0ZTV6_9ACTN|nr:MarR family transcriptional regulator [Phytohabitans sp. ZYX-F-186]MDQ7909605.1 MarR family transcriptional regulator [Phytohabitans sp. ZYX-F-186]
MTDPDALAAVQAWTRLDAAIGAFNRHLEREHGVTGAQLAILRIVREWSGAGGLALSAMRERLVMHPATLGQLLDRLATRGLVEVSPDRGDRRRRLVRLTGAGQRLLDAAPLAGPVRLRYQPADPTRLRRLAQALDDAIVLFGLEGYTHGERTGEPGQHRPEAGGGPAPGRRPGRGDPPPDRRPGSGPAPG